MAYKNSVGKHCFSKISKRIKSEVVLVWFNIELTEVKNLPRMGARSTVNDLFLQIQIPKYLILSTREIILPDNKSGVGTPYDKGPII